MKSFSFIMILLLVPFLLATAEGRQSRTMTTMAVGSVVPRSESRTDISSTIVVPSFTKVEHGKDSIGEEDFRPTTPGHSPGDGHH